VLNWFVVAVDQHQSHGGDVCGTTEPDWGVAPDN
jgi:hypothetical protein